MGGGCPRITLYFHCSDGENSDVLLNTITIIYTVAKLKMFNFCLDCVDSLLW